MKLRICLVAHDAYGALAGGKGGHIGGVERQTSVMAKWLARHGHQVSMVTWDEGQGDGDVIDDVHVFKVCKQMAGVPGLRFFWPQWSSLNAALKKANAHIYYQNCAECVTGQVALWCRRHTRKFTFSVASDLQCGATLPYAFRERILYRYGLRHADAVIVQTCKQQHMIRKNYSRDSLILPMPCPGPHDDEYRDCELTRGSPRRILWIGRICKVKRPDRLLDVAEACPDLHIDLVGPTDGTQYAESIFRRATNLANVTVHGPATRDRVSEFYRRAKVMCCTSDFEGFPNTFLEAWGWGVPIVSTFDPDNLIVEKGLGRVGRDVAELAAGIREMLDTPGKWRAASQAARRHYLDKYALDVAMERFERVFHQIANIPDHG